MTIKNPLINMFFYLEFFKTEILFKLQHKMRKGARLEKIKIKKNIFRKNSNSRNTSNINNVILDFKGIYHSRHFNKRLNVCCIGKRKSYFHIAIGITHLSHIAFWFSLK